MFPKNPGDSPKNPYLPATKHKTLEGSPRGNSSDGMGPKSFRHTHLGRLPPELRVIIYTELLATPPPFAGHDFAAASSNLRASSTATKRFVHIKASWRQVIRICRQIYNEAHPIFFASQAYFFANSQVAADYLGCSMTSFKQPLRLDTITALFLSGFVETMPLYSKERLDDIFSNPNDVRNFNTRQELEMQTFKMIWTSRFYSLRGLKSLETIALCFRVGEETLIINLLYCLTGMRRGFVQFVDASHWVIREQNPEDWSIQYSSFSCGDYRGKDNEEIPFDRRRIELKVTDINSRAPGLQEGDERFVEVSIQWPVPKSQVQVSVSSDQDDRSSANTPGATSPADTSDESDIEPLSSESHETRREVSPDQAEENALAEDSESDSIFAEVEPNSNVNEESPDLGLNSEDSRDSQETMATHQEGDHTSLRSSSEEVSGVQSGAQCSLPTENPSLSRSLERLARHEPITTKDDQLSLLDTSDRHDQIQDESDSNTPHAKISQHIEDSHPEHGAETDHVQQNLNLSAGEPSDHTNGTVPSSSRTQPLPEISNAPNPYTEEEMESYERWLQGSISRTQQQNSKALRTEKEPSRLHEKKMEHIAKASITGSTTKTPAGMSSTTLSQETPVMLAVASLLLLLILAILAYLP